MARVVFVLVVAALAVTASSGAAPAARAHVVVLETGWKTTTTDGQPQALGYGLELKNTGDGDAVDVLVDVWVKSAASGTVGTSDESKIARIPAHATFYVGGSLAPDTSAKVKGVGVSVHGGSSTLSHRPVPTVTAVRVEPQSRCGRIAGTLRNPLGRGFDPNATRLFVVYLNRAARIISGDYETLADASSTATVAPHSTTALSVTPGPPNTCDPRIVQARFSVSPGFD